MMINLREGIPPEKKRWMKGLSFVIAGVLIIELVFALKGFLSPAQTAIEGSAGTPTDLGRLLFTKYLYPFEITSVLIIAALVGAMILVKKKDEGKEKD
jgi:NADH-quinone oxidoreductase subunit J